jgi:hypothetical protein
MKRVVVLFSALVLLTGAGYTTQTLTVKRSSAASQLSDSVKTGALPNGHSGLQINGVSVPEPASIMLSSLALLACTTFLRRQRPNRA